MPSIPVELNCGLNLKVKWNRRGKPGRIRIKGNSLGRFTVVSSQGVPEKEVKAELTGCLNSPEYATALEKVKNTNILGEPWSLAPGEYLEDLLRSHRPYVKERFDYWFGVMQKDLPYSYSEVKFVLRDSEDKWGSCSDTQCIGISPWAMFSRKDSVDYLIIHELSHLKHFDHSVDFWDLVSRYCPDWQHLKSRLGQG